MLARSCIFILLYLYISSSWADQLLVEPEDGRAPIQTAIRQAQHSIDLIIYGFTDKKILSDIIRQKINGKTVQIILEKTPYRAENQNKSTISILNKYHVDLQASLPLYRFVHQKTLLIDNEKAYVMTFNFTHSAFKKQRNFGLIITNPKLVKEIARVFSADWQQKIMKFHSKNLIYSPDDSREKLISIINQSKKSIQLYAQSVSDNDITNTLANAARRGVNITIITSNPLSDKNEETLKRAGVTIHYSNRYYIHAKAMLIDHQKAVIGSTNLTTNSLDGNRELSVVCEDPAVINRLSTTFEQDLLM